MTPRGRGGVRFPEARVLVFAKAPVPGRAKTRLIPALGAEQAAALSARLLESTVDRLSAAAIAPIECWCTPTTTHPLFQRLAARWGVGLALQRGADLGERMSTAVADTLGQARAVVLVGGDCPVLEPEHLVQTLAWLEQGWDAVLGPAEDGGYVLLGLGRPAPALFHAIPWGEERVAALTRDRLAGLGWRWRELPPLWDLDRPEDLDRFRALAGTRVRRREDGVPCPAPEC